MLLSFLLVNYPFNQNFDGIFKNTYSSNITKVEASGSEYCYDERFKKDVASSPEFCIDPLSTLEWCSDIDYERKRKPWISVNFRNNKVKLSGYSLKLGCCFDGICCCMIYSWSLQGSNDNTTWKTLHKMEKQDDFKDCDSKSFEVTTSQPYSIYRIIQDSPYQGCSSCL